MEFTNFNVELIAAPLEAKTAIKNLARFYVYELSRYKTEDPSSGFPENGLYEAFEKCFEFDKYWSEPGYFPFIIRVNHELAGFVLVNKTHGSKGIDWFLSEFFIVAKFQGKGIGRKIAIQVFEGFKGHWELMQLPQNKPATQFWQSVLDEYTNGNYVEVKELLQNPSPHEMIIHRFHN